MGRRWWHYRVAHICFFDSRTMGRALALAGLEAAHRERYRWVFTLAYLAERSGRYLPTGFLSRALGRGRVGRRLSGMTVPVNLHDSWTYYARKSSGETGA
jgi:hypothetical protein